MFYVAYVIAGNRFLFVRYLVHPNDRCVSFKATTVDWQLVPLRGQRRRVSLRSAFFDIIKNSWSIGKVIDSHPKGSDWDLD